MQAREKSKAHVKIFTIEIKSNQNFNVTCLGLAFLQRASQCGACIPLLAFFAVLDPGTDAWGVRLFGEARST